MSLAATTFGRKAISAAMFIAVLGVISSGTAALAQTPSVFANFEEAQTNPVRISTDGTLLFAVNTPNASLSVFNVTASGSLTQPPTQIPVGLGPVSVNPRTDTEAWVVNQVSNSISVVSVPLGIVTDTINVGTEPMDVVFAGNPQQAYVSLSRFNEIAVISVATHAIITTIPVFGGNPRAMVVSPDGNTVYAAFAIAGNATTIIPTNLAPPPCGGVGVPNCVPPINPALPAPPQVGLIVAATDPNWTSYVTFGMPNNGVVAINVGPSPTIARYYSGVGTVNLGLAVNPHTGDLFVGNTAARNLTFFEPNLLGHWVDNQVTWIQVSTGTVTPFNLNPNINYSILPNPAALSTALAQPAGMVFDPSGNFMYVAAFGTDRVAQVSTNGTVNWFVEVDTQCTGSCVNSVTKRGPRGLALNPLAGTNTLYALNRITDSISVINTSTQKVTSEVSVGTNPTPATIKQGRGFLYDAKLSGNGTGACASCHPDGDMDHLDWNLGDPTGSMTSIVQEGVTIQFHPMKGPMATQPLRGLLNLSPYHWRGDHQNFEAFNTAFNQLMGGPELSATDMQLYTNFINTVLFLPNPYQNLDRTLPTSLPASATTSGGPVTGNPVNGLVDYMTVGATGPKNITCNECHTANPGPGSNRQILILNAFVPPSALSSVQPIKVTELRDVYQKQLYNRFGTESIDGFGLAHDGFDSGFSDFFSHPFFEDYTEQEKTDITAYNLCFDTGTAPAVGYTITLTAQNVTNSTVQQNWALLQSQAGPQSGGAPNNIDLIARGTVQGVVTSLLYQPLTGNYVTGAGTPYTQGQLQNFITTNNDTLTVMGVYPGTGSATVQP